MKTPLRILRAIAQDLPGVCPELTPRDQGRRRAILTAATAMMAERGPHTVSLTDIATAVGIPRGTIQYLFPDLDNLLATIIKDHLLEIAAAIAEARRESPAGADIQAVGRAAYVTATRAGIPWKLRDWLSAHAHRELTVQKKRYDYADNLVEVYLHDPDSGR